MPYNVDKDLGGDSKENTGWMERCVTKVEKSGKSKSSAIAICKAQMKKSKTSDSSVEEEIINLENILKNRFIATQTNKGKTFAQALAEYDVYLAKNDFELVWR